MYLDKKLINLIKKEKEKQEDNINLIASENYISSNIIQLETKILFINLNRLRQKNS